ncbi:hypothetical protein UGMREWDR_CDS0060 [Aeromonas phage GomatiRiver_11]|nr:hypothetical protein OBDJBBDK_00055 [Aeromonas phage AhFM11]WKW84227.1 hypothetical protein UGMREWDR_CDS0060 [Aeromonas phage GomatiRiver_11]
MKLYFLQHLGTKQLACFHKDAFDEISVIDHDENEPIFCHSCHSDIAAVYMNNHKYIWSKLNKYDYQIIERVI